MSNRNDRGPIVKIDPVHRQRGASAAAGATFGAILGSLVLGPIGAAVGGAAGAAAGVGLAEAQREEDDTE